MTFRCQDASEWRRDQIWLDFHQSIKNFNRFSFVKYIWKFLIDFAEKKKTFWIVDIRSFY